MTAAARTVGLLVGSLRKDSLNRKLAAALPPLLPETLTLVPIELGDLPLYNEDLEASPPAPWTRFRAEVRATDALLFVTPEYNRGVPGGLKNAIDVGSRPPKDNAWRGKPAGIITVSPGAVGGFGANHALRQSLMCVDVAVMPTPEMYLGKARDLFDEAGALVSDDVRKLLAKFVHALARWVEHLAPSPS